MCKRERTDLRLHGTKLSNFAAIHREYCEILSVERGAVEYNRKASATAKHLSQLERISC